MPIYEWKCDDCEIYWEDLYDTPEAAPQTRQCPQCSKRRKRAVSTFGMKFIGSGFYVNDYGTSNWKHKSSQGAAETFVDEAKKSSEARMKTGFQNYRVYTPNFKELEKTGQVKRTKGSDDEAVSKNAAKHRKTSEQIYTNAKIDPTQQEKTNVDIMTAPDKKGLL